MISKNRIISIVLAAMLLPATSFAQEGTTWFGDTADGQWLVGIKYGTIENDSPGFDDGDNYTLVLGYQFERNVGENGSASIEFEYGDSEEANFFGGGPGTMWDARTLGLFISYRTPGTVYFKARMGILDVDIEFGDALPNQGDTNFAYGAGFGVLLGAQQNINLEVDWTATTGDLDLNYYNIGASVRF